MYFLGFIFLRHAVKPWFPFLRNTQLLLEWALTSSVLILIVLAVRHLFRNRLSARLKYALWGVVLLRLLAPFQIQLPAAASGTLPITASNLIPEPPASWEERTIPVFSGGERPIEEAHPYYQSFQPGYLGPGPWSDGCISLSEDGKSLTYYADIFTPNEVLQSLWWLGVLGMAGALLVSNLRFSSRLEEQRKRLEGVDAPVPVYTAAHLPSPCLFGVFQPAVYLTPQAAEGPDTLRHVLAHELTHYAHKDHIWSLLRCLALALHWYNPLVWLAAALSKRDGELACDEGAVARLGEEARIPYGRTLVDMVAAQSLRPADLLSCSTAMTGGKKSIQRRVAALVKKPETAKTALFAVIALVALSLVFVFAGRKNTAALDEYRSAVEGLERVELAGQQENQTGSGSPELSRFLAEVERATAIQYGPPLYSSWFCPYPIADEDLLAAAKEVLNSAVSLGPDDPEPDRSTLMDASAVTLTLEDGSEAYYTLLRQDECTYVLEGAVSWFEDSGQSPWYSAAYRCEGDAVSVLENLARQQQRLSQDPSFPIPLTAEELEEYTPLGIQREHGYQLKGWSGGLKQASFYHGTRVRSDDTIQLWYRGGEDHGGVWVLEIWKSPLSSHTSGYDIRSDLPMVVYNAGRYAREEEPYEQLGAAAFAASLRPEDVISVTAGSYGPGQAVKVDLQALKEQLVQGLYHQPTTEYHEEKHGQYVITVRVEKDVGYYLHDGGRDGLILSIGSEPDVVCLRHRILSVPDREGCEFVRSPELYRTIRNIFD